MADKQHVDHTANHLFRQESGKMVAVLVKIFGTENLELAEDVVQDALLSALENWKFKGVPDNPRAWLYKTARNKAIDIIRRRKHSNTFDFSDPERKLMQSEYTLSVVMDNFWQEEHIKDDFLRMIFACCHPDISVENQITLILKSLCGFSTKEVARAFLTSEQTISKRLYRTKEFFRANKIRPEIPAQSAIEARMAAVLQAVYQIFNEGYSSTHSDNLIRKDLISQALFLGRTLLDSVHTRQSGVYALMALMCFHTARLEARTSDDGAIVLLRDQNRSEWDQEMIETGLAYLNQSATGQLITTYHFEAMIAYQHCRAKQYSDTDWNAILEFYNGLYNMTEDPVIYLNRCLAMMELHGAESALKELNNNNLQDKLKGYYLYHASLGEIYSRLSDHNNALDHLRKAMELTSSRHEKKLLDEKIRRALTN